MNYPKHKPFFQKFFKNSLTNELRPFKQYNFFKLMRMKSFFMVCKHNAIISNMNKIYEAFSRVLGRKNMNKFVECMYCDLLTGGSNFEELEKIVKHLEKENVLSIIDYCREFLTKSEEKVFIIDEIERRGYREYLSQDN